MSDWNAVRCTECGILQEHPQNSIMAFKCTGCSGGSYRLQSEPSKGDKAADVFIDHCPDCNTVNEVKELSGTTVCPMCHHNMKRKSVRNIVNKPVGLRGTASIDHPEHYTAHPSGVECITVVEHFNFNLGNAVKYIWRAALKGRQVEDLKKAAWYVQREIERLSKGDPG